MTRQEAAHLNGPKSRGPITPEGKAISSRNATTHGFFAKPIIPNVILDNETSEVFLSLLTDSMVRYQPVDRFESENVVTFVCCFWRHRRVMELETAEVNRNLVQDPGIPESLRTFNAFAKSYEETAFFANLPLYEMRMQRAVDKAEKRLETMLDRRAIAQRETQPRPRDYELVQPSPPSPETPRFPPQPKEKTNRSRRSRSPR